MAINYISAADAIRRQVFEVLAPAFYHPNENSDTVITDPPKRERINSLRFTPINHLNREPFRQYVDPDAMQNCAYSVEIMLDMHRKKIGFSIVHDHDIPIIFELLDRYLLTLKEDVIVGVENSINYARLVIDWRSRLYLHYFRFMQANPAALSELYPKNDREKNIFALFQAVGTAGVNQQQFDPLAAKAHPPYNIDEIRPKAASEMNRANSDLDDMGSSLGLSRQSTHMQDPDNWNHEEFLKGI